MKIIKITSFIFFTSIFFITNLISYQINIGSNFSMDVKLQSWGETFTAPLVENVLTDLTYEELGANMPSFYNIHVYEWDPTPVGGFAQVGPVGTPLYTSSIIDATIATTHFIDFPDITLSPGATYAIIFQDTATTAYPFGFIHNALAFLGLPDQNPGGNLFQQNFGSSTYYMGDKLYGSPSADLSMILNFTEGAVVPVPEPSVYAILGGCLIMVLLRTRSLKKQEKHKKHLI